MESPQDPALAGLTLARLRQSLGYVLAELEGERDRAGRSERGRRLALATTKAEEAILWLRHAEAAP